MGNTTSLYNNKNSNNRSEHYGADADFIKLSQSNALFITKLNEIASTYILEQNFQDMIRLTNPAYCDDLVVMTSEILNKSYSASQLNYGYRVIYKKGQGANNTSNATNSDPLYADALKSKEVKTKMCINIAKYYVKIAHLFAAIMTTLNPVFSWKTSASSKRALSRPVDDLENVVDIEDTEAEADIEATEDAEDVEGEGGIEDAGGEGDAGDAGDAWDTGDTGYIGSVMEGGEGEKGEKGEKPENTKKIQYSSLQEKHEISTMAKDVKVESLNFCNSRISDLMDMDEITSLIDGTNAVSGTNGEAVIKIKPRLCSSSLNNNNEGYTRQKSVYDLPGFAELSRLYFDRYNSSKKRFDRMSKESENEKKRNIALLYTLFTGNKNPPKDIKSFRDIPLHSFADTIECDNPTSALNATYIGTTKDKLFVEYVEQIKRMIYQSNMIRNSLLEVIDRVFVPVDDIRGDGGGEGGDDKETKPKFTINPKLSAKDLNECIDDGRKIILRLYMTCEKDFVKALKILQAIIEAQILETNKRQMADLQIRIEQQG
jgi:hypothetical protein